MLLCPFVVSYFVSPSGERLVLCSVICTVPCSPMLLNKYIIIIAVSYQPFSNVCILVAVLLNTNIFFGLNYRSINKQRACSRNINGKEGYTILMTNKVTCYKLMLVTSWNLTVLLKLKVNSGSQPFLAHRLQNKWGTPTPLHPFSSVKTFTLFLGILMQIWRRSGVGR